MIIFMEPRKRLLTRVRGLDLGDEVETAILANEAIDLLLAIDVFIAVLVGCCQHGFLRHDFVIT